ncbi:protein of unknown function [Taphrina deformans PYCC 5710]|uniref:Uncharacterized protein n=1 Tax=Taphrina deformans (strain PYCC 5710 / ATCC 11124 / CBS 356.35 / IMI 108563 / JCM 9778 / NBRC 8474) TaxID=1097556 RepID=R4XE12_TAPDE|nr:protein of unknown function [Taphrina deformans PYCC 5710]|eukprot:CCG82665.1 protein of unknown function [Taphrina deformans PYCC 5710]
MLHTFQSGAQTSSNLPSATQIRNQNADPYPSAQFLQAKSIERSQNVLSSPMDGYYTPAYSELPDSSAYTMPLAVTPVTETTFTYQGGWPQSQPSIIPLQPLQPDRVETPMASKTMRTIGTNTDPIPPGIWPDDLSMTPTFMQRSPAQELETVDTDDSKTATTSHCCPKAKDMPLKDLAPSQYNLTDSTTPMPIFSTFYTTSNDTSTAQQGESSSEPKLISVDHYEDDFDPEYFESIFDVPGCSLPGVQCRCGEDCSCAGCQTHKDNTDKVTFRDFENMDFSADEKVRLHPASCCDTRSSHVHDHESMAGPETISAGGCCGHKGG